MTLEELKAIANGNADAERFCAAWFRFCHLIDDLVDQDRFVPPEERGRVLTEFILEIAGNPFFQSYKAPLMAAITLAINAWVDSDKLDSRMYEVRALDAPPPTREQACTRDVLKGWWHEVFYLVAYFTGGYDGMQAASAGRKYDFHADALGKMPDAGCRMPEAGGKEKG